MITSCHLPSTNDQSGEITSIRALYLMYCKHILSNPTFCRLHRYFWSWKYERWRENLFLFNKEKNYSRAEIAGVISSSILCILKNLFAIYGSTAQQHTPRCFWHLFWEHSDCCSVGGGCDLNFSSVSDAKLFYVRQPQHSLWERSRSHDFRFEVEVATRLFRKYGRYSFQIWVVCFVLVLMHASELWKWSHSFQQPKYMLCKVPKHKASSPVQDQQMRSLVHLCYEMTEIIPTSDDHETWKTHVHKATTTKMASSVLPETKICTRHGCTNAPSSHAAEVNSQHQNEEA